MTPHALLSIVIAICISQSSSQSLSGRNLRITTIHAPPLVVVNSNISQSRYGDRYEGILIDIISKIASQANFTFDIHVVNDNQYGFESSPGQWNGMIGEVINNVADIAAAPLTIASRRAGVISFSQPIMDAGIRILYKKPTTSMYNQSLLILLSPFTTGLWFMILASFVVASLIFFAIGKLSPYEELQDNPHVGDDIPLTTTLINAFVYTISSFMHQERAGVPRSTSGRIMSIFWWIFTTLVFTTFAANFTAFLLVRPPDIRTIPFMSFDELSKQTDVKYGTLAKGYTNYYFSKSKRPLEQRLWKKMSSDATLMAKSVSEGVARVRNENYAFIMEGPTAEYLSGQYPCDTMVIGEALDDRAYGFACGQNSDVCTLLNPYILKLKQNSYLSNRRRKWMKNYQCSYGGKNEMKIRGSPVVDVFGISGIRLETQLSFNRFSAALFILLAGVVLSLIVLGGEIFYVSKFGLPQK
ncbi:glutamate receptor ionotropic, kainate glr-3-like [Haliotis cracherodii]|uniref:glutamate receptor ionotropic, kainate glr-3-like n=1 Tax=Haliotis cracherodii TaxID=6455 RepID=UPI0039E9D405